MPSDSEEPGLAKKTLRKVGEGAEKAVKPKKASREKRSTSAKQPSRRKRARERARAGQRALLASLAANAEGIDADEFVDQRKKSRNEEVAERAQESGTVAPVTDHGLQTMDNRGRVVEMARGSVEPDWDNNPEHLDTPAEVRASFQEDGLDPMDVDSREEAQFGHFLVHAMADDMDRGGRTPQQLEAEHDMVVAAMTEHGVDHESPLDLSGIRGGDQVGDPFGVSIDMSLGGGL